LNSCHYEDEIRRGSWPTSSAIPSEHELCATYAVSRTVVRQALGELVTKGLLYRVKGKGTFVAPRKLGEKFIQRSDGFYREMTSKGLSVRSVVRDQRVVVLPVELRDRLALLDGQEAVRIERLRFVDDAPMQLVTTYIPRHLCPGLESADLTAGSLYDLLRQRYGLVVASGSRTLEAVSAQRPISSLLQVPKGAALFRMESISYLSDGRPLEYYEAWHRGDRTKFEIEVASGHDAGPRPVGPPDGSPDNGHGHKPGPASTIRQ
jgi:GntR family transcriptional regulator